MITGRIDIYRQDRGFGFIHSLDSDGRLKKFFFHVSSVVSGEPHNNARVRFVPSEGKKGPVATEIEIESVLSGVEFLAGAQ